MPDNLTGLATLAELNEAIGSSSLLAAPRTQVAVYMDIGSLVHVTAVLGYHQSDELLQRMARLLCIYFPQMEAGRVGGDEFILLAPDRVAAEAAADRLQELTDREFEPQRVAVRANAKAKQVIAPPERLLQLSIALFEVASVDNLKERLRQVSGALHSALCGANGGAARIVVPH
jgi:GGDEF domain-containing protein